MNNELTTVNLVAIISVSVASWTYLIYRYKISKK